MFEYYDLAEQGKVNGKVSIQKFFSSIGKQET